MSFVVWQDRREVVAALKPIHQAPTAEAALTALGAFESGVWGRKYPHDRASLAAAMAAGHLVLRRPPEVRRIIYTTSAIASLNSTLRSAVRGRGHFPSDQAATKLLFVVLRDVSKNWKMPPREWTARTQFAILFGDRFSVALRDQMKPTPHTEFLTGYASRERLAEPW